MSEILTIKEEVRTGGGTKSTGVVLTDQPNTVTSVLWFASVLVATVLGLASLYVAVENAIKFALGLGSLFLAVAFPIMLAKNYFSLRLARYTVTNTYIEARTGIVPAQRLLNLYHGAWGGDLKRIYDEFSF